MVIVWDEPKRGTNLAKHGLDFAAFEAGFDFASAVEFGASNSSRGRPRTRLVGIFEGRLVVAAILSPLGMQAVALVRLRPASRIERRLYAEARP